MAFEGTQIELPAVVAGVDLSASQFRFVKMSADNQVILCANLTDIPVGVLQNTPKQFQRANVTVLGESKVALQGVAATGTITNNASNATAGNKVTITGPGGTKVYTFRATVALAGDVKVQATADATLLSLAQAINASGGAPGVGGDYIPYTGGDPNVSASTTVTAHAITLTSDFGGSSANSIALTTNEPTLTVSANLSGGGGDLVAGDSIGTGTGAGAVKVVAGTDTTKYNVGTCITGNNSGGSILTALINCARPTRAA